MHCHSHGHGKHGHEAGKSKRGRRVWWNPLSTLPPPSVIQKLKLKLKLNLYWRTNLPILVVGAQKCINPPLGQLNYDYYDNTTNRKLHITHTTNTRKKRGDHTNTLITLSIRQTRGERTQQEGVRKGRRQRGLFSNSR